MRLIKCLGTVMVILMICMSFAAARAEEQPLTELSEPETEESEYIYYDVPLTDTEQEQIQEICLEKNVPYEIILAIMYTESGFDRNAVGDGGDSLGIMQIQPKWLKDDVNLFDVVAAAETGAEILSGYLEKYADIEKALVCYNAGEAGSRGIYSTKYSQKVLKKSYQLIEENLRDGTQN